MMKYRFSRYLSILGIVLVCLTTSFTFAAHKACAQNLIDGSNAEAIFDIAKGYGSAELTTDSDGDPWIRGKMDGTGYSVFFYGCKNGENCTFIQFYAGWRSDKVSLRDVSEWNRERHFGKAYLDADDDPCLEMSVNLDHGVSRANLDDTFDWWKAVLKQFKDQHGL